MIPRASALGCIAALLLAGLVACQGPITEEDLELWTHNDVGLQRMHEVIVSPETPMATRVRALEKVVEKGFSKKVRGIIDEIKDDRAEIVKSLTAELTDHLEKKSEAQYAAKDTLLALDRYIEAGDYEKVKAAIGKWAFTDITWEAPQETVQKLGNRMSVGQIESLDAAGWEASAILLSHGFKVDKCLQILTEAENPQATKHMLRGLKKHHAEYGVRIHHLQALADTGSAEAATYLLDIYLDGDNEADVRATAFNAAVGMLDKEGLKKDSKEIVERLLKLMDAGGVDDRWTGALNIVHIDGVNRLEDILSRFKNDNVYLDADSDVRKSIVDLCLDVKDKGHGPAASKVFKKHINDTNPVIASISISCLKAFGDQSAKAAIAAHIKPPEDPNQVSLASVFGEGWTMSQFAQNAVDGLAMIGAADADKASKKIDDIEYTNKVLLVIFEMKEVGEAYTTLVDTRFSEFQTSYKANPEAYKEEEPKPEEPKPEEPKPEGK